MYESSERLNVLEQAQTTNTKVIADFNENLSTQLNKMVEEYQKTSQKYSEVLKHITTL